ncbi:hypothetical protein BT63DRAFT_454289 [Microthyrium microscopicum]|uniref:Uncharacterized protein n=1 Tax=Microthyrium microscopicum TaxID=703497 RepID=A0A6A6UCV3_9PEZI|nr:hypothetical protein BT63DRAFT_454289 [Microthyrium microscopicum]
MSHIELFDEASRGPLGALLLLFQRNTVVTLAAAGSVITILSLLLDASTQQLIEYPTRPVFTESDDTTFSHSLIYNNGGRTNGFMVIEWNSVDLTMQASVINGLSGFVTPPDFHCSSANCTWHDKSFLSLGFESTCKNVTTKIAQVCADFRNQTLTYPNLDSTGNVNQCNLTTPSNVTLQYTYVPTDSQTTVIVSSTISCPSLGYGGWRNGWLTAIQSSKLITIAVFRMYGYPARGYWEVIECDIGLVGHKKSNVSITNSTFQVGLEERLPLVVLNGSGSEPVASHATFMTQTGNHTFMANLMDLAILSDFLQSKVFNGTLVDGDYAFDPNIPFGPVYLNKNIDVSGALQNMTRSMTNTINRSSNAAFEKGYTIRSETYIYIRWKYFTLPVVMLIATTHLLLTTILKSRRQQMKLWKSSSVALLAHQINEWKGCETALDGPAALKRLAEKTRLKLSRDMTMEASD